MKLAIISIRRSEDLSVSPLRSQIFIMIFLFLFLFLKKLPAAIFLHIF